MALDNTQTETSTTQTQDPASDHQPSEQTFDAQASNQGHDQHAADAQPAEHAQAEPQAEQPREEHAPEAAVAPPIPVAPQTQAEPAAPKKAEKEPSLEDFATALETFEQEQAQTEAALNEEQIVTGTVLKVTPQYVVVDIGYKSEGVVPVSEFTGSRGQRYGATPAKRSP